MPRRTFWPLWKSRKIKALLIWGDTVPQDRYHDREGMTLKPYKNHISLWTGAGACQCYLFWWGEYKRLQLSWTHLGFYSDLPAHCIILRNPLQQCSIKQQYHRHNIMCPKLSHHFFLGQLCINECPLDTLKHNFLPWLLDGSWNPKCDWFKVVYP